MAIWITRESLPMVLVICPNVAVPYVATGCEKWASLKTLNTSKRNSDLYRSLIPRLWKIDASVVLKLGPSTKLRGALPLWLLFTRLTPLMVVVGSAKPAVLKKGWFAGEPAWAVAKGWGL